MVGRSIEVLVDYSQELKVWIATKVEIKILQMLKYQQLQSNKISNSISCENFPKIDDPCSQKARYR